MNRDAERAYCTFSWDCIPYEKEEEGRQWQVIKQIAKIPKKGIAISK